MDDLVFLRWHKYQTPVAGWDGYLIDADEKVVAFVATDGAITPVEYIAEWDSDNDENNLSPYGAINWK
jgi:hypothetical protein